MAADNTLWSREEFEQKLRDKEQFYHINHPFHKLMHAGIELAYDGMDLEY